MTSRSEQEMMQLIMQVAVSHPQIRAVLLNGSRVNPNVPRDIFQDYDIIYVVSNLAPFLSNQSWINAFGERLILQVPEDMELYPPSAEMAGAFSYLMQFTDGNRIDLTLVPVDQLGSFLEDSLSELLMDKDNIAGLGELAPASDLTYRVNRPSDRAFHDCCNEFWYTNTGLAKGLWREQIPYVKQLFHTVIQDALMQMLDWYIGCRHDFLVNPGKFGKFYKQYLEPDVYQEFLTTYTTAGTDEIWNGVFRTIDLFNKSAEAVAAHLGYTYFRDEAARITAYLQHVRQLPKNANRIY